MDENQDTGISVLGFREDESWCALGLEVGIRGYGETFEEACDDLKDLVLMQVSFAVFKGRTDMIWYPADPVYFNLFSRQRKRRLADTSMRPAGGNRYRVGSIPFPSPEAVSLEKESFVQATAQDRQPPPSGL